MIQLRLLGALILVLTLTHCSSSRPATTPSEPPAVVAEAPESTPEETPAPEEPPAETTPMEAAGAPNDWFELDATADGYRGVSADRVYTELLAEKQPQRTVVVAVIDSGIDIEHEDLQPVVWTNDDEVPGNMEDDDQNGYVDDVHGWNFIGGPGDTQVQYDTYELTREYERLSEKYVGKTVADIPEDETEAYAYFQEIEAAYEEEMQQTQQQYQQFAMLNNAVQQASAFLQQHFGKDEITPADLASIDSTQQDLSAARDVLLFLQMNQISAQEVADYAEHLETDVNYRLNTDFNPRDTVGDDYSDPTERDYGNNNVVGPDPEHGTHVAGIIGAARDNAVGIKGIAGSVEIMVLRAVPDGDERDKDIANAIRYAAENGANIINMSFGKAYSPQKEVVDEAVRYAEEQGVLMIHAAGNDGEDIDVANNYPSEFYLGGGGPTNWISVGAVSWEDGDAFVANFSNYGKENVDVFAPGVDIYSTLPGQEYGARGGTSMAAPVVSGIAALLMAYYPELTAAQVKDILLTSAVSYTGEQVLQPGGSGQKVDFGVLSSTGAVVNAYEAVKMADEMSR